MLNSYIQSVGEYGVPTLPIIFSYKIFFRKGYKENNVSRIIRRIVLVFILVEKRNDL